MVLILPLFVYQASTLFVVSVTSNSSSRCTHTPSIASYITTQQNVEHETRVQVYDILVEVHVWQAKTGQPLRVTLQKGAVMIGVQAASNCTYMPDAKSLHLIGFIANKYDHALAQIIKHLSG